MKPIKLIECPRDAMQSLADFVPTEKKIAYINQLLKVGFDTIDFGSFVSPKAIPQLRDTHDVIKQLDMNNTPTKLLAIIGNLRGATDALSYSTVSYLGFPFSISRKFLNLNIKSNYTKALNDISEINQLAKQKNKEMVIYLSMAFGNPYGEDCCEEFLYQAIEELIKRDISIINLADTVGLGKPEDVGDIFNKVYKKYPNVEFGLHLHTTASTFYDKVDQAYKNNCTRYDSVMLGLGGCPLSGGELKGNLSTENLLSYFSSNNISVDIDLEAYLKAEVIAKQIFQ